ncbi:Ger(x)C family spore germination C-terminal domain-containing protein [Clostridium sp. BJN0001]|uniref:Ger(x)C family spore germination C-terminal domain-containing protein n=1 Tax=Clostridium sp. BJN0001 TaxID=2930219 RepID=UPI001FCF959E|nr:Ger(x)C family spore germination C-terminal domain-containing protein [Clostridium sp. BJN0001]
MNNNYFDMNEFIKNCKDIPCGFQGLDPQFFTMVGEILGNVIAGKVPFNVQNALGNWFELVGQVILTCNSQQQYFQGGPGRYFDRRDYNVSNPFCTKQSGSNDESETNSYSATKDNMEKSQNSNNYDKDERIKKLEQEIEEIKETLKKLQK